MIARRLAAVLLIAVLAVVIASRLTPVRTIALTAVLVPELLGVEVIGPLAGSEAEPSVTTTTYGSPADRMDVWLPPRSGSAAQLPGVVLALGVHPQPIDHPDITRVARAISRLGIAVAVPDSTALRELRLTPTEPAHLADAVLALRQWPGVDPDRVGLAGFSAGASIALVAAADARVASVLRYVSAFGGYAHAERLLVDVATRTSASAGASETNVRAWLPDAGIRADILALTVGALEGNAARERLRRLLAPTVAAEAAPAGPDPDVLNGLAGDARQVYLLFTSASRTEAEAAIAGMSDRFRSQLAALSPLEFVARVRAPTFLLHGQPDTAIPVEHADALAAALGDRVERYTRFGTFGHEQPGIGGLDPSDASDVWELSLYLRDLVAAATE